VSVLCAGRHTLVEATDVEQIENRETGSVHCEGYDQRVGRPEPYPTAAA
jgi:hypothetical protein